MALVHDPNTGTYLDPTTGRVFLDAAGTSLSSDPGLNAQATRNLQVANQLYSKLASLSGAFSAVQGRQTQLDTSLDKTIAGQGPSVARSQLYTALDAIQRGQQSQAAGTSGVNAALARSEAMQNTAEAQAAANAKAAEIRAQETAQAQALKAQNLAAQSQGINAQYGANVTGAVGAGNTAAGAGAKQAEIDQADRAKWLNFISNIAGSGGQIATRIATA